MTTTKEPTNLVAALSAVQGSLPSIKKDAKGNFGKYVTLDAIHEAVMPLLSANGLAWVTLPTYDESGEPILEYKLMHEAGDKIEGKMRMFIDKQTAQGQGSALTYARRYAICAVIGITADDDDDGTAASTKAVPMYKKKEAPAYNPDQFPKEPIKDVRDDDAITDNQLKDIVALLDRKGVVDKTDQGHIMRAFAKSNFNLASARDMTRAQAADITMTIEAMDNQALLRLTETP